MKILVPLKRVPDADTCIRLRSNGSGIETEGVKFVVNPFDAIALEEALRLKGKFSAVEIVAVTLGGSDSVEQLRAGLAMGADRAVLIHVPQPLDSFAVAKVLAEFHRGERPAFVLMGKQAIDDDSNQAGQMLAGLLGIAQVTFVSKLELLDGGTRARCSRETDAGIETVELAFPAVLTTDLRLNEPRYISLPGIMKAKKKPIEEVTLAQLGVEAVSRTTVLKLEAPPRRQAGVRVKSVDELITKLRDEAKVI
ncbi:MAG: electron transfer flavoprotein subunit beta/FixA family protein [Opitutae bacterium]|nr:electron transfer flavoprotein subunit beta/FixA family protein [Opitutae bacterium]